MPENSPLQTICDSVAACWPVRRWASLRVLVGVSGGADSVCLLRTLLQMNPQGRRNLIVAHYDHRMRAASDQDACFVGELARELKVVCESGQSPSRDFTRSEADLRRERYDFLEAVARRVGARYVAVAHNRNDQVETILHNILRGTGGSGARGMVPFRPMGQDLVLARPLLDVRRSTIEAALYQCSQPYRTDPSNAMPAWTRNWLRKRLLPILRDQFPQADDALLRLGRNIGQLQAAVDHQAIRLEADAIIYQQNSAHVSSGALRDVPEAVIVSLLHRVWETRGWPRGGMTQGHWQRLTDLLLSDEDRRRCSRFHLPGNVLVTPQRDSLILRGQL